MAALARLRLQPAEEERLTADLDHILEAFARLRALDTTDVEPTAHVEDFGALLREDEVGIADDVLRANPRATRYVLLEGRLRPVPLAPPALLTTSLLGIRTKWRLIRDAFGKSEPPDADESVADFVRRKFTAELLDNLVAPFVSGIYAGDAERLSLRSAFPAVVRTR